MPQVLTRHAPFYEIDPTGSDVNSKGIEKQGKQPEIKQTTQEPNMTPSNLK
jgi:hypothetical protein